MSFETRVRSLIDLALSLMGTVPRRVREGVVEIDVDRVAGVWVSLDEEERFAIAFPFLFHQVLCEENPPRVEPDPWVMELWRRWGISPERYAEEYVWDRAAFYGAGAGMSYEDVSVKGMEFLRHLITYLRVLYSVIEPWKPTKGGGLCKLGFYAVRKLESFLAGTTDLRELLSWLASIVGSKTSVLTQLREAIYVFPWLKRWVSEYFSSFFCETLGTSVGTYADMLFQLYRDILGFMDWFKIAVIASYMPNPVPGIVTNCGFLGIARAATRAIEIARECLEPGVEQVCRGIQTLYTARGRPSVGRVLYRHCRRLLETLFGDPLLFMAFYHSYYSARAPIHLRRAYMLLLEYSGVPYYAIRLIFAYMRAVGQWGYPYYLAGR